jgi:hypothetical protein
MTISPTDVGERTGERVESAGVVGDPEGAVGRSWFTVPVLGAALSAGVIALGAVLWHESFRFIWFAFGDQGCNLTLPYLLGRGERPMVDFGYTYGLLSALVADVWARLLGRTPAGFVLFVLACNLAIAWNMARFLVATRARAAGLALVAVTLPFTVHFPQAHYAHALEPVLITLALAEHARGRRPAALAALTLACLVKPSLAYIYGLLLLVMTVRDLAARRAPAVGWARALGPAAACGLFAGAVLAAVYGPVPLLRTLFPTTGAAFYRYYNFGFFRGGRAFWDPTGRRITFYLGTVVGTWIVATAFLLIAAAFAALRWLRAPAQGVGAGAAGRLRDEAVLACATVHLAFVTLAWGGMGCWYYYFYVVPLGAAAAAASSKAAGRIAWVLVALAAVGLSGFVRSNVEAWRTLAPSPDTAGLWASGPERAAWAKVRGLTRGLRATVLVTQNGGTEQLFPDADWAEPTSWIYNRGITRQEEVERKARQIGTVDAVIMANYLLDSERFLDDFPEFRPALAPFERVKVGDDYVVYLRPSGR